MLHLAGTARCLALTAMVVALVGSAKSSSGPRKPLDPNRHVYYSPLFAPQGPGWTEPAWNVALGLDPQHVTVLEDTPERLTVKAARGEESIIFYIKVDSGTPDELLNAEIATFHQYPGAKVDNVWANSMRGKLLGEDTAGYSGHVNMAKIDQFMSRRGRCQVSPGR